MSSGTGLRRPRFSAGSTAARTSSSTSTIRAPGRSRTIAELKPRSLNIFIFPPSFDHLEQRLRDRGLNSEDEIQTRLQKAIDEIDAGKEFYDYVIINDDLNVAAECLKAAIIAKKLQTKTALEAITAMAERLKEERDGRFARGH